MPDTMPLWNKPPKRIPITKAPKQESRFSAVIYISYGICNFLHVIFKPFLPAPAHKGIGYLCITGISEIHDTVPIKSDWKPDRFFAPQDVKGNTVSQNDRYKPDYGRNDRMRSHSKTLIMLTLLSAATLTVSSVMALSLYYPIDEIHSKPALRRIFSLSASPWEVPTLYSMGSCPAVEYFDHKWQFIQNDIWKCCPRNENLKYKRKFHNRKRRSVSGSVCIFG